MPLHVRATSTACLISVALHLGHGRLLRSALLSANPLGPHVGEQLSIYLEVVQDAGVVKSTDLSESVSVAIRHQSPHTLMMRLPSKVLPWRHMVEPQSPL